MGSDYSTLAKQGTASDGSNVAKQGAASDCSAMAKQGTASDCSLIAKQSVASDCSLIAEQGVASSSSSIKEVKDSNTSIEGIKDSNTSIEGVKDSNTSTERIKNARTSIEEVENATTSIEGIEDSNISIEEAENTNTSTERIKDSNTSIKGVKDSNIFAIFDLPPEIFALTMEQLVLSMRASSSLGLRLVNKHFDCEILDAFFRLDIIEINAREMHIRRLRNMAANMYPRIMTKYLIHKHQTKPESRTYYAIEIQQTVSWLMKEYGYETEAKRLEYMEVLCGAATTILGSLQLARRMDIRHGSQSECLPNDILHCALTALAYLGDISRVKALLDAGVDANAGSQVMGKPLQAAAARGYTEIVVLLLENGADANLADSQFGATALQLACFAGHEGIVRTLLSPEYGVQRSGKSYRKAILNTARGDNVDLMWLLVRYGEAGLFHRMQNIMLHEASAHGAMNMVRTLLNEGADVNSKASNGSVPVLRAVQRGHAEIVRLLIARGALHGHDNLFTRGALHGHDILFARKFEANDAEKVVYGCTPICLAARLGYERVVQILLDAGEKLNIDGFPDPLPHAAKSDKIQMVQYLFSRGASPHSKHAVYAIYHAARLGNERMVRLLAAYGVDVNACYGDRPPILWALWFGGDKMVKVLLELGAQKIVVSETPDAELFASDRLPHLKKFTY